MVGGNWLVACDVGLWLVPDVKKLYRTSFRNHYMKDNLRSVLLHLVHSALE